MNMNLSLSKAFARTGVILSGLLLLAGSAQAKVYDLVFGTAVNHLEVPVNQSRIMVFDTAIENVSVGNPEVADIVILESTKIYILGKSLGSTNVVVWGKSKNERQYSTLTIDTVHDIDSLKRHLHELFPDEKPQIRSAQGSIILSGEISSVTKVEAIMALAKQFASNTRQFASVKQEGTQEQKSSEQQYSPEVINLMQVGGPHQVMLEVKIAEVSRNVLKRLGINMAAMKAGRPVKIGGFNGGASFPDAVTNDGLNVPLFPNDQAWTNLNDSTIGPNVNLFAPTTPTVTAAGLFASFLTGSSYFNFVIDASKDDGLAKILAEPTLTSLSGETAEFLSGGEFPVPIWQGGQDDKFRVLFKEYGVKVKMLPVVLDSKRINLNLNIGVSEISNNMVDVTYAIPNSTAAFAIPSLTTRNASSTVELMDGQTIGIAGLISDKMRESMNKFPGLGDLPVLGALFRSQLFIQDQTELVMFVTAHLAKPIDPANIRLPTDAFKAPSDTEFFLFGKAAGHYDESFAKFFEDDLVPQPKAGKRQVNFPRQQDGPTFGHQI